MPLSLLPDNAPFSVAQRAWLNGFFSGVLALDGLQPGAAASPPALGEDENFPWHDPALPLEERLALAKDKPLPRVLMAAMGQLDCGQCGYLCKTYAEAIATGVDSDLGKCVPGGVPTAKKLKLLVSERAQEIKVVALTPAAAAAETGCSRDRPVLARLVRAERLNRPEAEKTTLGIVLDLSGTGLSYEPGDSLGVFPRNTPREVSEILSRLGATGEEFVIAPDGNRMSAREALASACDLASVREELLILLTNRAADAGDASSLKALAEEASGKADYQPDVIDVLRKFPSARPGVAEFIAILPKLQPRLYSISSSLAAHRNEVHLTVACVRYPSQWSLRMRNGVASSYFARRLMSGHPLPVYLQRAHGFRLPQDNNAPVIMVGPGTGIAPFRAFLQERKLTGAAGKNWLFFGNRKMNYDFLYRQELEAYRETGLLTRLDTAFSQDQPQKIYVQHRILEQAAELWKWLQAGAYFYVCGDAKYMAADVERAMLQVVAEQGGMDAAGAKQYLAELASAKRYLRDVY